MQIKLHSSDGTKYTSHILPFYGEVWPKTYLKQFPSLKSLPFPEKDQWTLATIEGERLLLVSFDPNGNQKKIADTFRLLMVKAKKFMGAHALLYTSELKGHKEAAVLGMSLSAYQLGIYKAENRGVNNTAKIEISVKDADQKIIQTAEVRASAQMRAMNLVDLAPADKTPEKLGEWALDSAQRYGFTCEVWDHEKLVNMGMHAIHAVGKGSSNPPVFIISRYKGNKKKKGVDIALVGKGITFDTGGISIKPSDNLHYMKCDMAGGAAMLGAIELASRLKLALNITAIVPAAENAVDANSVLPGEVIHSFSGKTIEIINTDAEGRLVLADALAWTIANEKPERIVDMATLTGSSVRALGKEAAALYSDNQELSHSLMEAGYRTGEKLWPMPLWSDYDGYIHSDVADISNLPQSPVAGSIAAAKFLQAFTSEHPAWAHIDMPGTSFVDSPFAKMKSASGYGVQLMYELMRSLV